ncbi:MAG: helix-turn-helix domain-containing protein [Nitrosomonas sp.]|uniref:hypothetical protein n=1 Tax=Nitrosomonas sp. TaxID=42353 RepID=UPI0025D37B33|nr:hypothetical protein [Nitrosomonas sp.]MBY0474198.1 helix-turn-helix domain-containing protein [Nitrosomonas sp.]
MKNNNHHSKLIDDLGGPTVLAEKLGYDKKNGGVQRVSNWRYRGIPAAVILKNQHIFSLTGNSNDQTKNNQHQNQLIDTAG